MKHLFNLRSRSTGTFLAIPLAPLISVAAWALPADTDPTMDDNRDAPCNGMQRSATVATKRSSQNVQAKVDACSDGLVKAVEELDRGLVVIPHATGNVLSWRLLTNESRTVSFDILRNGKKINDTPLTDETFYIDTTGSANDRYRVLSADEPTKNNGATGTRPWKKPYLGIALNTPADDSIDGVTYSYHANDASVADLDGDGQYEIIVKWNPSNAKDNSHSGKTGNVFVDAYTLGGKQLWRIDLGKNIRAGAHYTQFIAYDFDGDGRAEVAMKTGDGTVDGRGNVIGDGDASHRDPNGFILTGPEYLTMFDGLSGEALDTIDYVPLRGDLQSWGDNYGNRSDRFLAGVAYLDGQRPSLLMARGYYTRAVVAAFDWSAGQFVERWVFDTNNGNGDEVVYGQGAHSLSIGDVDGDGCDEIIYGAATIDNNGHALYSTDLGHGDALHMSDIDPARPGLEVFMVHESPYAYTKDGVEYGFELHDAATGAILWQRPTNGGDIGRGVSFDVDPNYTGNEQWAWSTVAGMVAADGTLISQSHPHQVNFGAWWDGDLLRELLDHTTVYKWDYQQGQSTPILEAADFGAVSNNGTKGTPSISADIFGDWREEVMWANADSSELMIFSTTVPTQHRIPTLMQEPQYRVAIAWQNVAYNQPPHPGFYLGAQMQNVPDYGSQANTGSQWAKLVAHGYEDRVSVNLYTHRIGVKGAEVFRSTVADPESKVSIGTISNGNWELVDTDVVPDTEYFYWAELKGVKSKAEIDPGMSKTRLSISLIPQIELNISNNEVPVQLTWRTAHMEVSGISLYRAEATTAQADADFSASTLIATPPQGSLSWSDETAVAGKAYYYWVEFDNATTGDLVRSEPAYVETVLKPETNLTSTHSGDGITLNWSLQNFPKTIRNVELHRNTSNGYRGRSRLSRSVPVSGSYVDSWDIVPGTTYWYMFKITFDDGTIGNTAPEASITF